MCAENDLIAEAARSSRRHRCASLIPFAPPRISGGSLTLRFAGASAAATRGCATGQWFFVGRSFKSIMTARPTARFLSRRLTRVGISSRSPYFPPPASRPTERPPLVFTSHLSRVINRGFEGGTVDRHCAHVSCRKQTIAHMQGRNFAAHYLFPISRQNPMVLALRRFGGRSFSSVTKNRVQATLLARWFIRATHLSSTTHQSRVANHPPLPGTSRRM